MNPMKHAFMAVLVSSNCRWATALFLGVLGLGLVSASAATALSGTRPNIIVVMTDDQGYGDLSCNGHPYIKTPQIDTLRDQSMRFEDFHVSSSCAPSRGGLTKSSRHWLGYLKAQKAKGPIPELVIPGVKTDVRVVSMSNKKPKE